jgi:hypothetical protein
LGQPHLEEPMYTLRYYCHDDAYFAHWKEQDPQHWVDHVATLDLLQKIHSVHHIDHEEWMIPSDSNGWPAEAEEQRIYQEHFIPRAHILIPRLEEQSLRKAFKSNSGNLYLVGRVVILEDGLVGWATGTTSSFRRFMPPTEFSRSDRLYFLESVLTRGSDLLRELCFPVLGQPEQCMLERFQRSGPLKGHFRANVSIFGKQIDLVCQTSLATWIIEGKTSLTWEAYGQARGYTKLFERHIPTTSYMVLRWVRNQIPLLKICALRVLSPCLSNRKNQPSFNIEDGCRLRNIKGDMPCYFVQGDSSMAFSHDTSMKRKADSVAALFLTMVEFHEPKNS